MYLKGLNEGPEQNANGPTLPQELDQTGCSKKSQKTQVYEVFLKVCYDACTDRGECFQKKRKKGVETKELIEM